jgi:hypothetical protein
MRADTLPNTIKCAALGANSKVSLCGFVTVTVNLSVFHSFAPYETGFIGLYVCPRDTSASFRNAQRCARLHHLGSLNRNAPRNKRLVKVSLRITDALSLGAACYH